MEYPYVNIDELVKMDINIVKTDSLNGKSYIQIPNWLKNKKALINIKNNDDYCFLYCVLCHLLKPKIHPERVSHYKDKLNLLKFNDNEYMETYYENGE